MAQIIRRKIGRRPAQVTELAKVAPDRQWRLALSRAARDLAALDVDVRGGPVEHLSLSELLDLPPALSFLCVLEGPSQALGVLCLSSELLTMLIEMQTTGRLARSESDSRKPTRIDAAMMVGLIDAAMSGFAVAMGPGAETQWTKGFSYASFLEDVRPLGLILDDERFAVLQSEVSVPGTTRQGRVILALPATPRNVSDLGAKVAADADPIADGVFQAALGDTVLASEAAMNVVLTHIRLPLAQVMALAEGETLALPGARIDALSLETRDGTVLAGGRLGQARGMRAVRITEEAGAMSSPAFPVTQPMDAAPDQVRMAGAA